MNTSPRNSELRGATFRQGLFTSRMRESMKAPATLDRHPSNSMDCPTLVPVHVPTFRSGLRWPLAAFDAFLERVLCEPDNASLWQDLHLEVTNGNVYVLDGVQRIVLASLLYYAAPLPPAGPSFPPSPFFFSGSSKRTVPDHLDTPNTQHPPKKIQRNPHSRSRRSPSSTVGTPRASSDTPPSIKTARLVFGSV